MQGANTNTQTPRAGATQEDLEDTVMDQGRPTADSVLDEIDLRGKTALVTGGYGGVGKALAEALVRRGGRVVLCGRDELKGKQAVEKLTEFGAVTFVRLDLSDLSEVVVIARRLADEFEQVDHLVCNAGVMAAPYRLVDGYESHLLINHLGHVALAEPILSKIAPGGRVVMVSSDPAVLVPFPWDDPEGVVRQPDPVEAYGRSKTANLLCAVALDQRLREMNARAVAASPGVTDTGLGRHMNRDLLKLLLRRVPREELSTVVRPKTPQEGAATLAYALVDPEPIARPTTAYCRDGVSEAMPEVARDPDEAERLWSWSTGVIREVCSR